MIEILPESKGNILAFKATEKLTTKDYEEVFIPKLDELIREHGKVRVMLYLADSFKGWEVGAMWDDTKFGVQHRNNFEKFALVGGPKWLEWLLNVGSHFIEGQVKTYEGQDYQAALNWLNQ